MTPRFVYTSAENAERYQRIARLPAGRYKTSVHMKSYKFTSSNVTYSGAHYQLGLTAANNKARSAAEGRVVYGSTVLDNESALDEYGLEYFPYMVKTTPSLMLENGQYLEISLKSIKGTIAFDDFQLLYCGNTGTGSYELSDDESTLTLLSDWKNTPASVEEIRSVIEAKKTTLTNVYIMQEEVALNGRLNVTEVGWQTGNNILFYTDFGETWVTGDANIVRIKNGIELDDVPDEDGYYDYHDIADYSCTNLVITDQKPINVPQEFTAASANYKRKTSYTTDYWGSIVLPFEITKPENMTFYELQSVDLTNSVGTLNVSPIAGDVIAANEPVLFLANGALDINATDVEVHRTSELKKPQPETDPLTLYGTYKAAYYVGDVEQCLANDAAYRAGTLAEKPDISTWPNADGLCAQDCYYLKQNKFYRGYNYFTLTPFRAFVYRGCYDYLKQYYEDNPGETLDAEAATMRPSLFDIEIVEPIMDEIKSLTDETVPEIEGYYDVRGMRHSTLQKGVNIVRFEDGVTRKIFVK